MPLSWAPYDETLAGPDVGAGEGMDTYPHHHEALEVILRVAEDACQPARGHGRRDRLDAGKDGPSVGSRKITHS